MKIKNILITACLAFAVIGAVNAEVLFEDNFDSYEFLPEELLSWGFANLADAAPDKWISPYAGDPSAASVEMKVGPGKPGMVYYSDNNALYSALGLYEAVIDGQWGTDYTISIDYHKLTDRHTEDSDGDGYPDYENYIPHIYVAGRIGDGQYVLGGIALGSIQEDGKRDVYARIRDSNGGTNGDTWVAEHNPELPVNIELTLSGTYAELKVSHAGYSLTVSLVTDVVGMGSAGFGCQRQWGGYGKAYFDNFAVEGTAYVPPLPGDIDNNDVVDLADFAALAADWTKCSDPAMPECDQYWR
ncbi:hypothetical protein SMSP2_02139 [Limihaloglobus sulfuriphilus]|uniref:Carbohydrate-binding domain-containing protein n=1 Tax=Limihaloglobus sulfuriphilus TaxID=1851148 RepID=A0A1Q2MGF0_9BACT|nr:hypothetical protein [Limihaloglobus sulfuriphilus]AQQ71761.1 hypothetical protein SMSP2_02139 [Limihaloglobus sulfuriphilus]